MIYLKAKFTIKSEAKFTIKILLALIVLLAMSTQPTMGQIYKWVDKDGVPHFSNVPVATEDNKQKEIVPEIRPPVKKCIRPKEIRDSDGSRKKDYWDAVEYQKCLSSGGISDDEWR